MFQRLKDKPLLGMAAAICCGILAARVIMVLAESGYRYFRSDPERLWAVFDIGVLAGLALLIYWLIKRHRVRA